MACLSACKPANTSDNRFFSQGKPNSTIVSGPAGDKSGDALPAAGDPNPALAQYLPVSYTDDLEPMVKKLCTASCHQGPPTQGPFAMNTLEDLKAVQARAATAIDAGSMPPNQAQLSASDKKILAQLSISLKNWAKNETFAESIAEFKITYDPAVNAVATALCIKCHQGDTAPMGLQLTTQEQWKAAMPRILQAVGNGRMPPNIDDVQAPRLTKFLKAWETLGFP
jgi:hypothetical protein